MQIFMKTYYGKEKHLLQVKLNLFFILAFKDILK